ncbi:Uncharacterized protein SCF082_LOCUS44980 [Durusdinium trenchii]|uniref:Uncharacterized protein n=1 Tax=Durusdinium trenchii TaxID=1381693 RepID=A0ABP0R5E7_9DINO
MLRSAYRTSKLQRPKLKIHGAWAFGHVLRLAILEETTYHGSSMVWELIASTIDDAMQQRKELQLAEPDTVIVVGDNTVKELKNTVCLMGLANWVNHRRFRLLGLLQILEDEVKKPSLQKWVNAKIIVGEMPLKQLNPKVLKDWRDLAAAFRTLLGDTTLCKEFHVLTNRSRLGREPLDLNAHVMKSDGEHLKAAEYKVTITSLNHDFKEAVAFNQRRCKVGATQKNTH